MGTAEQIVAKLQDLHRIGVDGVAMTWVNYVEGIAQFNEEILPLMEEAGLRSPRPVDRSVACTDIGSLDLPVQEWTSHIHTCEGSGDGMYLPENESRELV